MDGPTTLPASLPLKDFLTLVLAALALVVTVGTAIVAWRSYAVNAQKLRLDLYHMRFALCRQIMELADLAVNDQWRDELDQKRPTLMLEARFLFGHKTEARIDAIFFEILNYRYTDVIVKNLRDKSTDEGVEFQNKRAVSWKQIHALKYKIATELSPYLDFHNVGLAGFWSRRKHRKAQAESDKQWSR